jgi:hypothetical protein
MENYIISTIENDLLEGKTQKQIIDEIKEQIKEWGLDNKILKITKKYFSDKKKGIRRIDIDELERQVNDFGYDIFKENEQWNKERKEIKYLNVKKKKTKIIDLKAYYIIDKTGQSILSEIKLKDEELLTPQIKRKVIKDLTEKLDSHIKAIKRESDIRKMSGGAMKSRQRMVKIDSESDSDY